MAFYSCLHEFGHGLYEAGLLTREEGVVDTCPRCATAVDPADLDALDALLPGLEQDSISQRFARRGVQPAPEMLVVAIDEKSFDDLRLQWPFPRSRHAMAIDRLAHDGARSIVYDVQFTERTRAREDRALADAETCARVLCALFGRLCGRWPLRRSVLVELGLAVVVLASALAWDPGGRPTIHRRWTNSFHRFTWGAGIEAMRARR